MAAFAGAKRFAWALIMLAFALIVLFFALAWLHSTFSGNAAGRFFGAVGSRASGQAYNYNS